MGGGREREAGRHAPQTDGSLIRNLFRVRGGRRERERSYEASANFTHFPAAVRVYAAAVVVASFVLQSGGRMREREREVKCGRFYGKKGECRVFF